MIEFSSNRPLVCLAPMAGYTDVPFRALCREQGASLLFSEMVSAQALVYENARTQTLLSLGENEALVVQLFGKDPAVLAEGARRVVALLKGRCLGIDINMGCPAPKITSNGEGSALMREPVLAGKIVEAVAKAVPVPVSVKFRKGWDEANANAVDFAKRLADSGVSFLTVHGRTRTEFYAGRADWGCIKKVKAAVSIPVIGNGDVTGGADVVARMEQSGCDGVMIGRGALGNPFVFAEVCAALSGKAYAPPTRAERNEMALRHAELAFAEKGERGLVELRKHLPCYLTGFAGASRLRARLQAAETLEDIRAVFA